MPDDRDHTLGIVCIDGARAAVAHGATEVDHVALDDDLAHVAAGSSTSYDMTTGAGTHWESSQ